MGHGRFDKAGPSLARDVEEASAGNGRAQSSVPTFLKRSKYNFTKFFDKFLAFSPDNNLVPQVTTSQLAKSPSLARGPSRKSCGQDLIQLKLKTLQLTLELDSDHTCSGVVTALVSGSGGEGGAAT